MHSINVDFNARTQHNHVVARVPAEQLNQLTIGEQIILCDPIDLLFLYGKIASVDLDTESATFIVDWDSATDSEKD